MNGIPTYRVEIYNGQQKNPDASFHADQPFGAFQIGGVIHPASNASDGPLTKAYMIESVEHILIQEEERCIHSIALRCK
jgi:hypothetical protein